MWHAYGSMLLISDACVAAGLTFFCPRARFLGARATKDRLERAPPLSFFPFFSLSLVASSSVSSSRRVLDAFSNNFRRNESRVSI